MGQAALVLGGYGFAVYKDSFDPRVEVDTAEEQESLLEDFFRTLGFWHTDPLRYYKDTGYSFYGYGGEAQVFAEKDQYVHKVCRIAQYDSPVRFLDLIVIHNTLCPIAALHIEGFGRNNDGEFVVLMKQRFFRQDSDMSEDDITGYMQRLGFWKSANEPDRIIRYYSDTVIAEDLHQGNIWRTADSNVVIIDGAFRFNTPDLGKKGIFLPGESISIVSRECSFPRTGGLDILGDKILVID